MHAIDARQSGLDRGDLPGDPKKLSAATHRLSFEVDRDTFAAWREAVNKLRAEHDGSLTDDEVLAAMARWVLAGPTDEGPASYQIGITVCEECEQAFQQGSGQAIPIADEVLEMASCALFSEEPTPRPSQRRRPRGRRGS